MNKGKFMNHYHHPVLSAIKEKSRHPFPLKHRVLIFLLLTTLILSSTMFSYSALAQEQLSQEVLLSEAELAQLLAPIALYPDTLLTHFLIAATYPIEVIEAERWLTKHSALTTEQLQNRLRSKEWDASVKALLPFPRVMGKLSNELNWMQNLGDAFLQDEARILASIQTLRQQAEQAGSLENLDNVKVVREQKIIIIEPAQPEVIYVPYYDTRVVYGRWHWSYYPPVYWHNPHHYASYNGHFYWGHGVHINTNFFFSAFHWSNRHVVVSHHNRYGYHSRKKIVVSHNAKRWHHQPKHRRGVAYSSGSVKNKYYSTQSSVRNNASIKGGRNNKSLKHTKNVRSTRVKSSNVHKGKVHSSYSQKPNSRNINAQAKNQVKQYKNVQSKQRGTNKKVVKAAPKSNKNQRGTVHKQRVSRATSTYTAKTTKHHKRHRQ
jgi:hypothetical protein